MNGPSRATRRTQRVFPRWVAPSLAGVVVTGTLAYAFLTPTRYEATALVAIEQHPDSTLTPVQAARRLREASADGEYLMLTLGTRANEPDIAELTRDIRVESLDGRLFAVSVCAPEAGYAERWGNALARRVVERAERALRIDDATPQREFDQGLMELLESEATAPVEQASGQRPEALEKLRAWLRSDPGAPARSARSGVQARVVRWAERPNAPVSPNRPRVLLSGSALALLLSLPLIVLVRRSRVVGRPGVGKRELPAAHASNEAATNSSASLAIPSSAVRSTSSAPPMPDLTSSAPPTLDLFSSAPPMPDLTSSAPPMPDLTSSAPPDATESSRPAVAAAMEQRPAQASASLPADACAVLAHDVPSRWRPDATLTPARYDELRSQIYPMVGTDGVVLAVFGATAVTEQKSRFAAELALALADHQAARILLVEADFTAPLLSRYLLLEMPPMAGFSEQLHSHFVGSRDPYWYVLRCKPSLHVLLEGPIHCPEMLSSPMFERGIRELREYYDVVLILAPSLTEANDLRTLTNVTDGCLVVRGRAEPPRFENSALMSKRFSRIVAVS